VNAHLTQGPRRREVGVARCARVVLRSRRGLLVLYSSPMGERLGCLDRCHNQRKREGGAARMDPFGDSPAALLLKVGLAERKALGFGNIIVEAFSITS